MTPSSGTPHRVFVVAGEESGDQLGRGLLRTLRERLGPDTVFLGVGGRAMESEGLRSLFPLSEITAMGIGAVVARLPAIWRRGLEVVEAAVAARPDVLVIIDSPDFTHRVARRIRARMPDLPIVNYVSPSVWAWRPGRARAMRPYVDHVLALLPFEPEAHARLGGPPCTYVGHPLVERLHELRPAAGERRALGEGPPLLLVLPGSRRSEIARLMEPFGEAVGDAVGRFGAGIEIVVPAVPHLADAIHAAAAGWPVPPRIVVGEADKLAAFRRAHAALAASGTVTLELALAGIPMVVGYRVSKLEEQLKYLIKVPSIVLANLVLGDVVVPERVQWDCTPDKLAAALLPLLRDTAERRRQTEAFARLDAIMETGSADTPSGRAAAIVARVMEGRGEKPG